MNLSFQNPAALAALPLAAVPWALHRWSLTKARPMAFPSLELLRAALRASFASSFLSHRVLLALRTLLALFLVLLPSKPVLRSGGKAEGAGPLTVVLAVDASASMAARAAGRSALAWAREEAMAFLPAKGSADRAGLVVFSDRAESTVPLTSEPAALREALDSLEPTFRPTRIDSALEAARGLLSGAGAGEKTVILLTDAARNGWRFRPPAAFDPSIRLVIARPPSPAANGGVASLRLAAAPGESGRLETASWGASPRPRGWTFSWDDRFAAQGRAAPGGSPLPFLPTKPLSRGVLALEPDALSWDDSFYVLPSAGAEVGVLVVNGAPALTPSADETYFLSSALDALRKTGLRSKTVLPAALETEPLEGWNVLMILNAGALAPKAAARVRDFVERGGGIWMTAGDRFDPGPLAALLPARPTGSVLEGEGFALPAAEGPVAKRLAEEGGFTWDGLLAEKVLETAPLPGSETVLAGSRSGRPLLVTGKFGRGRTALLATTVDRDWTNLPAHPLFPVLCRDIWLFLSGQEERQAPSLTVDQPWEGPLPAGAGDVTIERPDGTLEAPAARGGRFRYEKTDRPGFYTLRSLRDPAPLGRAAVNADRASEEGDLAPASPADVKDLLPFREVSWIDGTEPVRRRFDEIARGRPLSAFLAGMILLLVGLETAAVGAMKR